MVDLSLQAIGADLRFTSRLLRKSAGFTAVAVLSLALGIGATTAIFSVIHAVLLDPYPYKGAGRIVNLVLVDSKGRQQRAWYSKAEFLEVQRESRTLEEMVAMDRASVVLRGSALPEVVVRLALSPNGLDFFGVPAMLGRNFSASDSSPGRAPQPVAVLSYLFWQRHFAGRNDALGQQLRLESQIYTVIGVLPPRFAWADADVYIPLELRPSTADHVAAAARLKPGVIREQAAAELKTMNARFALQNPRYYPSGKFGTRAVPLNDWILGKFAGTLLLLLAAVGCLLLIACGNIANLLLARASGRRAEMAVRAALGAGRARVLQQLLTESVLLALLGGLLGVLLAYRGVPGVIALLPEYAVPHEAVIHVDGPVLWFALGISVLTGLLFGLAPALELWQSGMSEALKGSGRAGADLSRGGRLRDLLLITELSLSLMLLAGAGLAVRGFVALQHVKLGCEPAGVLSFIVPLAEGRYTDWSRRCALYRETVERMRALPGVQSAAVSVSGVPPWTGATSKFEIESQPASDAWQARLNLVSAGYLETLRIPLLRGRFLSDQDVNRADRVAVISEDMARRFWPEGRDPLGQRVRLALLSLPPWAGVLKAPAAGDWFQVVGVAGTVRNSGLREEPAPAFYIPYTLLVSSANTMLLRTASDPMALARAVREGVHAIDPDQPVALVRTLEQALAAASAYPRFSAVLLGIFGAVGLLLAASGVFSVVSYAVARRKREFGIRLALGAQAGDVLRLVLGRIMGLTAIGLVLGLAAGVLLSRLLANQVEGMERADPSAFAAVCALLAGVALAACYIPARRATRIDPVRTLREE